MYALIVDDSRAIRSLLTRPLRELGFTTLDAGHGQAALDVLATCTPLPTLALVDWNMPVMDGLEFVRNVRRNERLHSLKIMMITTEVEAERIQLALDAGADEYLMKPFTMEALSEKLALLGFVRPH